MRLGELARFLIGLREVLRKCNTADAGSWKQLAELLDTEEATRLAEEEEVAEAVAELSDVHSLMEERLIARLVQGRSRRVTGSAVWSHDHLNPEALTTASSELQAFPLRSSRAAALDELAALAAATRTALLSCDITDSPTWTALLEVIGKGAAEGSMLHSAQEAQEGRLEVQAAFSHMEDMMQRILASGASSDCYVIAM